MLVTCLINRIIHILTELQADHKLRMYSTICGKTADGRVVMRVISFIIDLK